MKTRILSICFSVLLLSSCSTMKVIKQMEQEQVSAANFKTEIPFEFPRKESILIQVPFSREGVIRKLKFDNHAPFALDAAVLKDNKAFSYVGKFFINKPTPDGTTIDNAFYLTDSVRFGSLNFNHVVTNIIPDRKLTDSASYYVGLFGSNLMVKGVWEIDFQNNRLVFASSIDSLPEVADATVVPARFTGIGNIILDVSFGNDVHQKVELDLGYNGPIMLPKKIFDRVDRERKATSKKGLMISSAGTTETMKYNLDSVKATIGDLPVTSTVRSTDNMISNLIGLAFFSKYRFVVLDYVNRKLYLAK